MNGCVYFVGAGPGAADLITVRGKRLLEEADIIVYAGSLVNPALLEYAREDCRVYNSAYMTLEEVAQVLITEAGKGKKVVRLHTGDPSIYSAAAEQMELLNAAGVSYETCPGVSAAFGAAASLDLEYTLPEISQTLILTRMEGRTKVPERESIVSLAAHQSSMAVYLSAGMLEKLAGQLMEGGYAPDTPAVLIYKATWPEEEAYYCTLSDLARTAQEHGIRKTALVLVGEVIRKTGFERSRLYAADFSTEFRAAGNRSGKQERKREAETENRT